MPPLYSHDPYMLRATLKYALKDIDAAFLGIAESANGRWFYSTVYSKSKIYEILNKDLLKKESRMRTLVNDFMSGPKIVVGDPMSPEEYDKFVNTNVTVGMWADFGNCDPRPVVGVVEGDDECKGMVYDLEKVIATVTEERKKIGKDTNRMVVEAFVHNHIIPVSMGGTTPSFLTKVTREELNTYAKQKSYEWE